MKGLKNRLYIVFYDQFGNPEAGIDDGGLFKEFLSELSVEVFDPERGLFNVTDDQMVYPNPNSGMLIGEKHLEYFYFIGSVVGRALYEGILLETKFANFFLRRMQGKHNYLSELESLDKELYKNLKFLKTYEGDCKDLMLTFSVKDTMSGKEIELKPNGKNNIVTDSNKFEYIYKMAHYKMNT